MELNCEMFLFVECVFMFYIRQGCHLNGDCSEVEWFWVNKSRSGRAFLQVEIVARTYIATRTAPTL